MSAELPASMNRFNSCCFTGHRFLPKDRTEEIREETRRAVGVLIGAGYRHFLCGGALGYDTLAAQIILTIRQDCPDVRLILALPCTNQTEKWSRLKNAEEAVREYNRILEEADAVCIMRETYEDGCMRERNLFMVDHASFCIACYNGNGHSGAGQTYRLAKKSGLMVYNVWNGEIEEAEEKPRG